MADDNTFLFPGHDYMDPAYQDTINVLHKQYEAAILGEEIPVPVNVSRSNSTLVPGSGNGPAAAPFVTLELWRFATTTGHSMANWNYAYIFLPILIVLVASLVLLYCLLKKEHLFHRCCLRIQKIGSTNDPCAGPRVWLVPPTLPVDEEEGECSSVGAPTIYCRGPLPPPYPGLPQARRHLRLLQLDPDDLVRDPETPASPPPAYPGTGSRTGAGTTGSFAIKPYPPIRNLPAVEVV